MKLESQPAGVKSGPLHESAQRKRCNNTMESVDHILFATFTNLSNIEQFVLEELELRQIALHQLQAAQRAAAKRYFKQLAEQVDESTKAEEEADKLMQKLDSVLARAKKARGVARPENQRPKGPAAAPAARDTPAQNANTAPTDMYMKATMFKGFQHRWRMQRGAEVAHVSTPLCKSLGGADDVSTVHAGLIDICRWGQMILQHWFPVQGSDSDSARPDKLCIDDFVASLQLELVRLTP